MKKLVLTALTIGLLLSGGYLHAQTYTFDVIDDTILLNNGGNSQAEQNFGGRTELILAKNGANPRDGLLRFDVSAAATEIMDPSLIVTEARLTLNPRDERLTNNQGAVDVDLGLFGIVSENEGWVEGTAAGAGAGLNGQFGSVSRLYLATPSSATPTGGPADDGLQWFSAGGGPTSDTIPTQFDVTLDTTNVVLGSASTTGVDTSGGDADFDILIDGPLLDPFLGEWLAAPLMDDGNGGMQTSNAGLILQQISDGNGSQWFFESIEGAIAADPQRLDQIARLTVTFARIPEPSSMLLLGMAGFGLAAIRMYYRWG